MTETVSIRSVPAAYAEAFRVLAENEYARQADLFVELVEQYCEKDDFDEVSDIVELQVERERQRISEIEERLDEMKELEKELEERRARVDELQKKASEMGDGRASYEEELERVVGQHGGVPPASAGPVVFISDKFGKSQQEVHSDMQALVEGGDA